MNQFDTSSDLIVDLDTSGQLSLHGLQKMWKSRPDQGWDDVRVYQLLGEQILKIGEPLLAYDALVAGIDHWPQNVRLRQLLALALARSGAVQRSNQILLQLCAEGHSDGETLGILARTYKDLWAAATEPEQQQIYLVESHQTYYQAFVASREKGATNDAYYNGINAAATALFLDQHERARSLAFEVRPLCRAAIEQAKREGDLYWATATLGEAALILGELQEALTQYARAAELGQGRYADLSSTHGQAQRLLACLGADCNTFDHCFAIPSVAVLIQHNLDTRLHLSEAAEVEIKRRIGTYLQSQDIGFGYASLTCACDLFFLEAILEFGGEIHVVMPLVQEDFIHSVAGATGEWELRYQQLLNRATQVYGAGERSVGANAVTYEYSNLVLDGLSRLRSNALATRLVPLTMRQHLDQIGSAPPPAKQDAAEVVDISDLVGEAPTKPAPNPGPDNFDQRIMAMLFADVVGYSKLTEAEIPYFVQHFMGTIAQVAADSPHKPVTKNTWGDAIYFVFSHIEEAGHFALEMLEVLDGIDWTEKGLSTQISLRIALHSGPVYSCTDPVLQQLNFVGSHVSWAARIEPITPPGQVYASQPFVALAKARGISAFTCDYVGQIPLAKHYGVFPLYHVRRS